MIAARVKTINARLMVLVACLFAFVAAPARAQTTEVCLGRVITTLNFSSTPTLVSGTALSVGAVYRYSNVNTGIDALVRIVAFNNGATLTTIDNNTAPAPGAPDLRAFLNPELGGSNARSVDFQISFVSAGTNAALVFDFAATAIDVDGDSGSIREYAEFQNVYAEYLVNNPTRLSVNASGPSAGNTRFESTTNFTAPGIDPTANENIVAAFYSKRSSFNYRIGTLGSGSTVRLTSLQFTCPNLPSPVVTTTTPQDFGDAPASYGNVRHDIATGIRLGVLNTTETAGYNSPLATGDLGDDGVVIGTLRQTTLATATVTIAGAGGRLQAWFDWNRDGDFLDAGEQVATDVLDNSTSDFNPATGVIELRFTVPATASTGSTFSRFRWATQSGLDPSVIIGRDGEVEDYVSTVLGVPFLATTKTSAVHAPTSFTTHYLPANDVIYTIAVANTGSAATDANSILTLDALPSQVDLYLGDFDGAGPATGTVLFTTQNGATLTFTPATDLKFSDLAATPANFAACTYVPAVTNSYDPAIRHVCLNPKGALASGSPAPGYTLQFRTRIK